MTDAAGCLASYCAILGRRKGMAVGMCKCLDPLTRSNRAAIQKRLHDLETCFDANAKQWIDARRHLPGLGTQVMIWFEGETGNACVGSLNPDGPVRWTCAHGPTTRTVTHWRPLPPGPSAQEEKS